MLPNKTYDDLAQGLQKMHIRDDTSPISIYIQHPIPIPAPGDKNKATLKPLKLTKKASAPTLHASTMITDGVASVGAKENAEATAAGRAAGQTRPYPYGSHSPRSSQRYASVGDILEFLWSDGFHEVRLANLMKVLTSDAVQDPTKVEARVRREVTMRKHQHEKMNAERKLTDDQRRDKIENKKLEEEKKGIYGAVFK